MNEVKHDKDSWSNVCDYNLIWIFKEILSQINLTQVQLLDKV